MQPHRFARAALLALLAACAEDAFGPGAEVATRLAVTVTLPPATPAVWAPQGETLHVMLRRAGRVEPVLDTSLIIGPTLGTTLTVGLTQEVERFVATAEVRYGGSVLFLAFDAVQLVAGTDTAITLAADYVGPGAGATSYALAARDTTLVAGDTSSLTPLVRDSLGQSIPNVPVRYLASRPTLIAVDSAGVLSAVAAANDTARVTGFLPMGLSSDLLVSVVMNVQPPAGTRFWIGGAASAPNDWFDAANWSPAGVPGAGDTVVIDATASDPTFAGRDTVAAMRITGGILSMGRGTLVVTGNLATSGNGALEMSFPEDTVRVLGAAVFAGVQAGGMRGGVLFVGGDVDIPGTNGIIGFNAFDTHRVVMNGAQPQRLSVEAGSLGSSFQHLDIANTGGRILIGGEHTIQVNGKLRVLTPVTIDDGSGGNGDVSLGVDDSLVMVAGSRLTVFELSLGGAMAVAGAFAPAPGGAFRVRFNGYGHAIQAGLDYRDVEINDSVHLTGRTTFGGTLDVYDMLDLNGQTLVVSGNLHTQNGEGRLIMQRAADTLDVLGDALFEGDSTPGFMTDGVLRMAGHFEQRRYSNTRRNYRAGGQHRTIFNGSGRQNLLFADEATFGHLEFANSGDTIAVIAPRFTVARTVRLSTPRVVADFDVESSVTVESGDSMVITVDATLAVPTVIARGVVLVAGTLDAGLVDFAGSNQAIPSTISYRNIAVSGDAHLTGRTVVAQGVSVQGPQANLTLAGNTIETSQLSTGGAGFGNPVTGGTITMQAPAESLIVSGDVALGAAATPGSLSAGVLVAGAGFFQYSTPAAFQPTGSHRTVLAGTPADAIDFEHAGSGASQSAFRHLEVRGSGIFLRDGVFVTGTLSGGSTTSPPVIAGLPGTFIDARGADLNGLTLDGVTLAIGDQLARLDSVTFQQQSATATQLSVVHPGAASPFTLTGLSFLTAPTSGAYISATDSGPSDGQVLTIDLAGSQPGDGSGHTVTAGGAVVNWPGGGSGGSPFASTGDMTVSHYNHGAILLNSGRALVVGGLTTTADLFDPATGTFAATTGQTVMMREGLTATLLYDGRVLLTGGGQVFPATTRTAELYDPATQTFALTDSLGDAIPAIARGRRFHTATRLNDGTVLVTGGVGVANSQQYRLATAETYDPIPETFTVRTSPARARARHVAVLLPNGRVLIAGGETNFGDHGDTHSEIFDPANGSWAASGNMTVERNGHTGTVLADGRVLITGGSSLRQDRSNRLASAELYDPATGTFSATGSMAARRQWHTATLLADGRVLIAGGLDQNDEPVVVAELFDPVTGTFSPAGTTRAWRDRHASVRLADGTVLLTGGIPSGRTAEIYVP